MSRARPSGASSVALQEAVEVERAAVVRAQRGVERPTPGRRAGGGGARAGRGGRRVGDAERAQALRGDVVGRGHDPDEQVPAVDVRRAAAGGLVERELDRGAGLAA